MGLLEKAKASLARRPEANEDPFTAMHREMNRMFEQFNRNFNLAPANAGKYENWSPKVNIAETDQEIQVTAELPGVDQKDVDVTLDDGVLTIRGEKKEEKEAKEKDFHRYECSYGSFQRSFTLPREVEMEKVDANFKNGVLTVKLPKTFEAKNSSRKIAVKSA